MSNRASAIDRTTDTYGMLGILIVQENTIERLRVLALEWHGKHLATERFALRVYEILVAHDEAIKIAESKCVQP